jgi:OOP family OmpA-OmpF porin
MRNQLRQMNILIWRVTTTMAVLLAAGQASAQSPDFGFYLQADAGSTHFDLSKARLDQWTDVSSTSSSIDRGDMGFALAAGFRFSPYLAVEASYLDLGRTSYLVRDNGASARLNLGSKGPAVSVLGSLPINHIFSLEGRAGLYFSDVDLATFLVGAGLEALFYDEGDPPEVLAGSDPGWVVGAGVAASFGRHWSTRLRYDYFDSKAAGLREPVLHRKLESRAGRWMIGIRYSF